MMCKAELLKKLLPSFPNSGFHLCGAAEGSILLLSDFPAIATPSSPCSRAPQASFGRCGARTCHAEVNQLFHIATSSPRHGEQARL